MANLPDQPLQLTAGSQKDTVVGREHLKNVDLHNRAGGGADCLVVAGKSEEVPQSNAEVLASVAAVTVTPGMAVALPARRLPQAAGMQQSSY